MKKSLKNQIGRSRIEMLGVLAIIGVLSVAGIEGYTKAMVKYKLNKQAEQHHTIIEALIRRKLELRPTTFAENGTSWLTALLISLNEIPKEMEIPNDTRFIRDAFGVRCYAYSLKWKDSESLVYTCTLPKRDEYGFFICRNFFQIAKEWRELIYLAHVIDYNDGQFGVTGQFYGDKYCKGSSQCLNNMTLEKIDEACRKVNGNGNSGYEFGIRIKYV